MNPVMINRRTSCLTIPLSWNWHKPPSTGTNPDVTSAAWLLRAEQKRGEREYKQGGKGIAQKELKH
jgi:hypothetical protein